MYYHVKKGTAHFGKLALIASSHRNPSTICRRSGSLRILSPISTTPKFWNFSDFSIGIAIGNAEVFPFANAFATVVLCVCNLLAKVHMLLINYTVLVPLKQYRADANVGCVELNVEMFLEVRINQDRRARQGQLQVIHTLALGLGGAGA